MSSLGSVPAVTQLEFDSVLPSNSGGTRPDRDVSKTSHAQKEHSHANQTTVRTIGPSPRGGDLCSPKPGRPPRRPRMFRAPRARTPGTVRRCVIGPPPDPTASSLPPKRSLLTRACAPTGKAVSQPAPGIYALAGWGIAISYAIDAPGGWIIIDTGDTTKAAAEMRAMLEMKSKFLTP